MKVTASNLKKLDTIYKGYLENERIDAFFTDFNINFAAGLWAAGGFNDRFVGGGYNPGLETSIVAKMSRVAQAGIKGVELHDSQFVNEKFKRDENKVAEIFPMRLVEDIIKRSKNK